MGGSGFGRSPLSFPRKRVRSSWPVNVSDSDELTDAGEVERIP